MKINSALSPVGTPSESGRARGTAATPPQTASGASERVDISTLSARLMEAGAGEAPVDTQRIAEIKQAISEGRFQINPERIADGLLASVRDMVGKQQGKTAA